MKGLSSNVREIITVQKKAGITYNPSLTLAEIEHEITKAYKHRRICKKNAESLSMEYRTQLAYAKEEAGECKAATYIRSLNSTEACRRLYQNIRYMERLTRAGATSQVTITKSDGSSKNITDPQEMDQALLDKNERLYHQIEVGSDLLSDEGICIFLFLR